MGKLARKKINYEEDKSFKQARKESKQRIGQSEVAMLILRLVRIPR